MDLPSAINAAGLLIELCGVGVLARIDLNERTVLEAQTRLQKAHYAYLANKDPSLEQHFLLRRNNHADRTLVDSHDPRQVSRSFRCALYLLALGMVVQLAACFF